MNYIAFSLYFKFDGKNEESKPVANSDSILSRKENLSAYLLTNMITI